MRLSEELPLLTYPLKGGGMRRLSDSKQVWPYLGGGDIN